ncbi:MAG: glycosyltransferase family 39 protein [Deltaproteobacteria bacterium]|nr:glycosyltransferase family 39 protein [Deltaproteobacteria bacterium]
MSTAATRAGVWGLVALAALLYGISASRVALLEPDEGRYAEIGREMVESGDWLTPRLNYVKYLEKPPLVYWATAVSFLTFGSSELSARLPVVLSALATLALTGWLARRLYGGAVALLAVALLALSPLFGVLAVVLTLDMPLTAFMTAAMCAAWRALAPPETDAAARDASARRWVRVTYAATALAILVKGPVAAVLLGAIVFVFALARGGGRGLLLWLDWRGFAVAAAIALPWFVLVGLRNPEFFHFFVVDQHLTRYTSTREHGEPPWFFLPVLPLALAPWGLALLFDPGALRPAWDPRTWAPGTRFCALWAVVIVAFFSLSASKLLTYVLPAMPPLAILCARAVLWSAERGRVAGLVRVGWLLLVGGLVLGFCAAVLPQFNPHFRIQLLAPFLAAGAVPMAATGWLTGRCAARGRASAALLALGAGWALLFAVVLAGRSAANEYRPLALAARAAMTPDDRLALYHKYVQGMPYYTGRRVVFVGRGSELKFGSQQGDHAQWFWRDDADLVREWAAPGRLFVLLNRSDLDSLRPQLDPAPIEIATKDKKVLVKNRP